MMRSHSIQLVDVLPAIDDQKNYSPSVKEQRDRVLTMSEARDGITRINIALIWACALNYHEVVISLVNDDGANVNSRSFWGMKTALMFAAGNGHTEIVKFLLENNANPNAKDASGWTPLMKATKAGHQSCVELLLKYKAIVTPHVIVLAEEAKRNKIASKLHQAKPPTPEPAEINAAPVAQKPQAAEAASYGGLFSWFSRRSKHKAVISQATVGAVPVLMVR